MNLDETTLKMITTGFPEFILSLPEHERPAAWRTFLKYAELLKK